MAGANVIVYYLIYIAEMAGLPGDIGMITSSIPYALLIVFTLVTWAFLDKTGRPTFLITSPPVNTVIAFSFILIAVYGPTLCPMCWIYAAEVWSLGTRTTALPLAFVNISWKIFIIFGVLCTYSETLEEVELMFSKDGPHPWNTQKGEFGLEAEIEVIIIRCREGLKRALR
ncbi:hypothetical protein GQ53DRAFT_771341 [Thozetella sp. PMI_491]|nr:hypothetical protein GQ53DRAFT_771341 [Thozetella sp. PMI_491]